MTEAKADTSSVNREEHAESDPFKENVTSLLRSEFGDREYPLMEEETVKSLLHRHFHCSSVVTEQVMRDLVGNGEMIELRAKERYWLVTNVYSDQSEMAKYTDRSEVQQFTERYDVRVSERSSTKSSWWIFPEHVLEVPWKAVGEGCSSIEARYVDEPPSNESLGMLIECTIPSETEFDRWKTDVHVLLNDDPKPEEGS